MVIIVNITKFHVDNVKGGSDIKSIRDELQAIDGVHAVRVDDVADTITVEYEDNLSTQKITDALSKYKDIRRQ
jgi:copper chaperone CopZ